MAHSATEYSTPPWPSQLSMTLPLSPGILGTFYTSTTTTGSWNAIIQSRAINFFVDKQASSVVGTCSCFIYQCSSKELSYWSSFVSPLHQQWSSYYAYCFLTVYNTLLWLPWDNQLLSPSSPGWLLIIWLLFPGPLKLIGTALFFWNTTLRFPLFWSTVYENPQPWKPPLTW